MSRLLTLRDTIVDKLAAAVPGMKVDAHLGRFTEAELKKFVVAAPAAKVAILALDKGTTVPDEGVDYPVRIGIYVVTKDVVGKASREEAAAMAVEAIVLLADRQRWGLRFTKAVDHIAAQNMYSAAALADGVALWAIDMRQVVRIAAEEEAVAALKTLFLGFAPEIGAGHEKDYVQIAGQPVGVVAEAVADA